MNNNQCQCLECLSIHYRGQDSFDEWVDKLSAENARLRESVKTEREACAVVAETFVHDLSWRGKTLANDVSERIAEAIRARTD